MSHSSQGQIADRALIHVDTEVSAKCPLNSRMAYVSVSRARHDGQLFTNDRKRSTQRSETMFPLKYAWGQEKYDAK